MFRENSALIRLEIQQDSYLLSLSHDDREYEGGAVARHRGLVKGCEPALDVVGGDVGVPLRIIPTFRAGHPETTRREQEECRELETPRQ